MISIVFFFVICHTFVGTLNAAGVLAHIEVLRRATYILGLKEHEGISSSQLPVSAWLEENMQYAQAGAFFPDWGYGCLIEDEAAEAAHWPPFIGASIEYLLETQSNVNSSAASQQLLSFILGLASHQNTDASWHSIKLRAALLRVMADVDFRTDYNAAHTILDVGGDTILAREFAHTGDEGFAHLAPTWIVPLQDIIAIYARLGYTVNKFKVRYCMARGFAALSAVRNVGPALATRYQSRSPFMTTNVERHFLGSIAETSTSTVLCWKAMIEWIISGIVPDRNATWLVCEPMRTISRRGKAGPYETSPSLKHSFTDQSQLRINRVESFGKETTSPLVTEFEQIISEQVRHLTIADDLMAGRIKISSTAMSPSHAVDTIGAGAECHDSGKQSSASYFITPSIPYAEFGTSLALIRSGSDRALAVGSPRDTDSSDEPCRGGTYIVPVDSSEVMLNDRHGPWTSIRSLQSELKSLSQYSTPQTEGSEFGRSVASITLLGIPCLAVLSRRKVEIFRSSNGTTEIVPFVTITDSSAAAQLYSSPPLASHIYTFDMKGFAVLALSSAWAGPGAHGKVYLFGSEALQRNSLLLHDADLVLQPGLRERSPYARFGSSLTYSNDHHILYIGSAGKRQVTSYKLERTLKRAEELFQLHDPCQDTSDTGFGASAMLTIGNFLYIGAHTQNDAEIAQAGVVHVFHLSPLYKKNSLRRNIPWTVKAVRKIRPQVQTPFSQFGYKIVQADAAGGVYVSSPTYDCCGAIFYVPSLMPPVPSSVQQLTWSRIFGGAKNTRAKRLKPMFNIFLPTCFMGHEPDSRFGDDIVVGENGFVAIGAPFEQGLSTTHRRAGKVYISNNRTCN